MTTKQVILLNGPPRSGKDAVSDYLRDRYNACIFKFADPLIATARAMFDFESYDNFKLKEIRPGLTGRDFIIKFSEEFAKPLLGNDVWANRVIDRLLDYRSSTEYETPRCVA